MIKAQGLIRPTDETGYPTPRIVLLSDDYLADMLGQVNKAIQSEMPALPVSNQTMLSLIGEISASRQKAKRPAAKKTAGRKPTKRKR